LAKNRLPGKIVVQEEQEPRGSGADNTTANEPCEAPPEVRVLMKGLQRFEEAQKVGLEECAPSGPIMPYCEDDEPERATVMPHADEAPAETTTHWSFFGSWLNLFRQPAAGATESCEPPAGHAPDCQEDPACHHPCPGCPYNGPCPKSSNVAPTAKPKKVYVPFEEELQDTFPEPTPYSDVKQLLKQGPGFSRPGHSKIDTTECRPSDFGFDFLGLRSF
jgi:hypothetical protein